ncbi:TPA: hypothetical protein ACT9LT_002716, partial [Legionella pneumophila]
NGKKKLFPIFLNFYKSFNHNELIKLIMVKSKAYDKFLFEPTFPNPCFVDSTRDLGCLEKNLF